jgi:hypothetical protein
VAETTARFSIEGREFVSTTENAAPTFLKSVAQSIPTIKSDWFIAVGYDA